VHFLCSSWNGDLDGYAGKTPAATPGKAGGIFPQQKEKIKRNVQKSAERGVRTPL
jgi:hypothetical protein